MEGKTIYHAGDLNWWHWDGEPEKDNQYQEITYKQEINRLHQSIDLAFVVVDKRQEGDYLLGLQYFLTHVQAHYIMPIHYFGDYTITEQLQNEQFDNPYYAKIIPVHHQGETFEIF